VQGVILDTASVSLKAQRGDQLAMPQDHSQSRSKSGESFRAVVEDLVQRLTDERAFPESTGRAPHSVEIRQKVLFCWCRRLGAFWFR
jgi:hypothetical protein